MGGDGVGGGGGHGCTHIGGIGDVPIDDFACGDGSYLGGVGGVFGRLEEGETCTCGGVLGGGGELSAVFEW